MKKKKRTIKTTKEIEEEYALAYSVNNDGLDILVVVVSER